VALIGNFQIAKSTGLKSHLILKAEIAEIAFKTRLFCFFKDISILFCRANKDIFNH